MKAVRCFLGLFLLSASAQAALVNFVETSVNAADGTTIGAVATDKWLETGAEYATATAAPAWSSFRFTHWTNSGYPAATYRDAWGRSLNPSRFVLLVTSTATAHYLPTARDSDGDGVPDWYEIEYFGNLDRNAASDTDSDGITLLAEYTGGTHPLYGNSAREGGVAWTDSALVTCNLAGYATYTLRSVPAGTVNQSAVVPPGTVVVTPELSANATFGYWTLDGVRQQDAWGVALTKLTFTVTTADREAVAYLFVGDTDADGVPDAYEQRYYGTLANNAASDTDSDGITLLAEYTGGTHPLYGNSSREGGVAWVDSALVTCNLAGYVTYTLRSVPAGTVNQSAVVPPGTVVVTPEMSANATFGYWTLDGVRQQDAWGVPFTRLSFTVTTADREAVAYLFTGDSDSDGVPDAYEQRYLGTLANNAASDADGDGLTLLAEYSGGTNPLYGNSAREGGVAWADSALLVANLQPEIAVEQPSGTDLADGGARDFGSVLVGGSTSLIFTIRNHGGTDLTGLVITKEGANASEFTVTASPVAPVVHNGSTTFTIRFSPVSVGAKAVAIHIANNDPDENPFDLNLAGEGLNNAPTISDMASIGTARNTATGAIAFTVGDVETAAGSLNLSKGSSNTTLVPLTNIVFGGTGANRTVTVTPAANQTGTATITVTVSDGSLTASDPFTVTVTAYPPLVTTGVANNITPATTTLNGTVNPNGFSATAQFEYGLTTAYGSTASVTLTPPNGSAAQSVSAALTGLVPWTSYHYRLTASSNQGVVVGNDATFTTAGVAPVITLQPQSQTVTVRGDVTFTAAATGIPTPAFEWRKNGAAISGATGTTLTLTNVQSADASSYTVVVTNAAGSVTSDAAVLTVNRLAQIISFASLPNKQVNDAPFTLAATASSGLPVSYTSFNPAVATVSGNTVTITGVGSTVITASQAGDGTYLPADDVSQTLNVMGTGSTVLVTDDFAGSAPDATKFEWGGDVAQTGSGQFNLSTNSANTSWLRSKAGAAPGAGETLVLQLRLAAYAEGWNPGIYGDGQPRGLRVGSEANNAVEFYSVSGTSVGLRVRKNGVESLATYALPSPSRVDSMHDYEISVSTTSVVFKVDGIVAGTITTNIPTGALNAYVSTFDGYAGNVPVTLDSLKLTLIANKLGQTISFTGPTDRPFTASPITLSASAASGLPVVFSVVSGPALVAGNTLTLTGAGAVVVRASQAGNSSYLPAPPIDCRFTVTGNLDSWRQTQFTSAQLNDSNICGAGADPDGDGLTNLLEYALDLLPLVPNQSELPEIGCDATNWLFTYTRAAERADLRFEVQVSTDLVNWSAVGVEHVLVNETLGGQTWQARYPRAQAGNLYFRLRVTQE